MGRSSTLAVFDDLDRFVDYYSPFWVLVRFPHGNQHSPFWMIWTVLWTITHHFGCLCDFRTVINTRRFSQLRPCFMGYYSPFRGFGAITTIEEPRGVFIYLSSLLAV